MLTNYHYGAIMKTIYRINFKEMKDLSQNLQHLQKKYLECELADIVGRDYLLTDKDELLF